MATRHKTDPSEQAVEATDLKRRVEALRQAAGMPEAQARPLLDAALAELDAAVSELDRAGALGQPDDGGSPQPNADRRLLHAIFQQAPVALFVLGRDGAIRRANTAAAELVGTAQGYATGRSFAALVEPPSRAAVRSQLAAAVRTGEPRLLSCGLYGSSGVRQCQVMIRTVSVRGDDDRLLATVMPNTVQEKKGRGAVGKPKAGHGQDGIVATTGRIDVVTAINKLLLENVVSSEGQLLQRFGRLLADRLASWAIIDLCDDDKLRRHSIAGPDREDSAGRAQIALAVPPTAQSAPGQVARSGSPMLVAHPEDEDILGVTEDGVPLLMLLGGACLLCAPIAASGISYGTLTLVRGAAAGTFGLADMGLAEDAADQLARTIAVQRTMRQRAEAAEALQGSLLPRALRPIPGVEMAAAHIPPTLGREVGGDFYDIYPTPDGWGIAIGDVVGKGQDSASVTAAARHAIRVLGHWNADPAEVLRRANEVMLAEAFGGRFVTADAAHLSWHDGTLRVVLGSAGHPGPVRVKPDGRAQLIEGGGEPLGIFADGEAKVSELDLATGEVLFFCTDGLTGARSPEFEYFGERLTDSLAGLSGRSPADIVAGMQRLLVEFCGGVLLDDVTMLALRVGDPPS
ncbi:MAG TPA: SpoIIE family protein phosphatase [Streptosporangiaceae bacterium]|nr:SpoIIE family protein phosphatase [Streptosporangiaceae bacterium]